MRADCSVVFQSDLLKTLLSLMFCINPHHRKVGAKHNKDSVRTLQNVYG